jgi:hypothetical protein
MSSTISPGMHPVISALRVIDTGLDELAEGNLWSLLDSESLEVRVELERLAARLHAARLRATREVATRGAAIRAGAPNTRAWLINKVRLHPGEAGRELTLAGQLADDLPATAAALAAGEITPAAAAVIADSDAKLRKVATAAQRADAEAFLAEQAAGQPVQLVVTSPPHPPTTTNHPPPAAHLSSPSPDEPESDGSVSHIRVHTFARTSARLALPSRSGGRRCPARGVGH